MPAGSPWPFGVQWVEAEDSFNFSLVAWRIQGDFRADAAQPLPDRLVDAVGRQVDALRRQLGDEPIELGHVYFTFFTPASRTNSDA
jgi:hypothetical protein